MQGRRSKALSGAQASSAPSSYEVLGVLMAVQLVVRGALAFRKRRADAELAAASSRSADEAHEHEKEASEARQQRKKRFTVDGRPLASVVFDPDEPDQAAPYPDEEDAERRCTLCLGTMRDATATECGHVCACTSLFLRIKPARRRALSELTLPPLLALAVCWECVVGWAREKVRLILSLFLSPLVADASTLSSRAGRVPALPARHRALEASPTAQYVMYAFSSLSRAAQLEGKERKSTTERDQRAPALHAHASSATSCSPTRLEHDLHTQSPPRLPRSAPC